MNKKATATLAFVIGTTILTGCCSVIVELQPEPEDFLQDVACWEEVEPQLNILGGTTAADGNRVTITITADNAEGVARLLFGRPMSIGIILFHLGKVAKTIEQIEINRFHVTFHRQDYPPCNPPGRPSLEKGGSQRDEDVQTSTRADWPNPWQRGMPPVDLMSFIGILAVILAVVGGFIIIRNMHRQKGAA